MLHTYDVAVWFGLWISKSRYGTYCVDVETLKKKQRDKIQIVAGGRDDRRCIAPSAASVSSVG